MPATVSTIYVSVPNGLVKDVLKRLDGLGGQVTSFEREGERWTGIHESIPTRNIDAFRTWLDEFSGGRGKLSVTPDHPSP
jgi:translation elongation factor EF-G